MKVTLRLKTSFSKRHLPRQEYSKQIKFIETRKIVVE